MVEFIIHSVERQNRRISTDTIFLGGVFLLTLILFRKAFAINFFIDDFFFLKIGQAHSVMDFLRFFSLFKDYFYRPIPTELFYYLLNQTRDNLLFAHSVVFVTYFIGLTCAYNSVLFLTKNRLWSRLVVFIYAISFIHVFQLYQLATFIEVALFSFLAISFYFYIKKRFRLSWLFFILACMSKETAIVWPFFLGLFLILNKSFKLNLKSLIPYAVISGMFAFIFKFGVNSVVTTVDTYVIHLSLKLGINNLMWYGLWALGLPSFMPDYLTSIFQKPISGFWQYWQDPMVKAYLILLALFLIMMLGSMMIYLLRDRAKSKRLIYFLIFCGIAFGLFISPTLLILHKWMVRLTVPLFFLSIIWGFLIAYLFKLRGIYRWLGIMALTTYCAYNFIAIGVHESASTYLFETAIVNRTDQYMAQNQSVIQNYNYLYFADPPKEKLNTWGASQKLKVTYHDQDFLNHYFPKSNLQAIYSFENQNIPAGAIVIQSDQLVPHL